MTSIFHGQSELIRRGSAGEIQPLVGHEDVDEVEWTAFDNDLRVIPGLREPVPLGRFLGEC